MKPHVCPVWVGYLMLSPLRRWMQRPEKVLGPYVEEGMTTLDVGCAMGFFSLPLARMTGIEGRVICVDLQEGMIRRLAKRAKKADLSERIVAQVCTARRLGLEDWNGKIDFTLAFAVMHEHTDQKTALEEIAALTSAGGGFLVVEPRGHVSEEAFEETVRLTEQAGFSVVSRPKIPRCQAAYLIR